MEVVLVKRWRASSTRDDASYNASYWASYFPCETSTAFWQAFTRVLSDTCEWGGADGPFPWTTPSRWCKHHSIHIPTKSYSLFAMCRGPWSRSQQYPNGYPACHGLGPMSWVWSLSRVPPHHLLSVWCDPLPGARLWCCQPSCVVGIAEPRFTTACGPAGVAVM